MIEFTDKQPRKKIDLAGLAYIYERQFGALCNELTAPEIEHKIKTFGKCQCGNKKCKEPLAGYCEFDHHYPNGTARKGDVIEWRSLTKACHLFKTRKRDTPNIAKIKRTAKKYNPEYMEPESEKPKSRFQSRKMNQKHKSNVKVID